MKSAKTISTFQFMELFPNEVSAVAFIEKQVWGDQTICPHCNSKGNSTPRPKRHGHRCNPCRKDFTVRIGTIFNTSRLPLKKWLYAIYLLQTSRKGISSLQLSKELGITKKTAWYLLQRVREACNNNQDKLNGTVEIDATYIGGKEANKHANKKLHAVHSAVGKQAVMGMREQGGKIKPMPVDKTDGYTLQKKVVENVRCGASIYTDIHRSYIYLGTRNEYQHGVVKHSIAEYVNGMAQTALKAHGLY